MKKTAIICLLLFFSICFEACELAASEPHILKLETPEKVAEVYQANEEYFNLAAETILKYDPEYRIYITSSQDTDLRSDSFVGKQLEKLFIQSTDSLSDADYQTLSEAFAPLMERCNLCGVGMYASRVEFVLEGPTYGMAAELFYFLDSDFAAEYKSQTDGTIQINPHWYAEIWHD